MSDNSQQRFLDELNHIYATINQHDVEQFYAGYQLWYTRQRITTLQEQIGSLRQQISENAERLQQVQLPAVAFATLARLQAKGVNDIDLLDRMLERGEEWLDLTMQRLDYCEQLDFIHDNYAQWCEHALEGAYDWIDSMRDAYADTMPRLAVTTEVDEASVEAAEELLIQKLASEEEWEEEASSVEITLKRPAVPLSPSVPATGDHKGPRPPSTPLLPLQEKPPEPGLQGSPEEEPVAALETQEAGPPQGSEMSFPSQADTEADSSLVSSEQAYVEFAPAVETETEEAGSPQGLEMSFPVKVDAEADSLPASSEQVREGEYVEFAPPSQASPYLEENIETDLPEVEPQELATPFTAEDETEADLPLYSAEETPLQEHADLISSPETSFPAEATPTADESTILVDQITSPELVEPASLPVNFQLDTPAGTEFAASDDVGREEPIPSKADTTHNPIDSQVSMLENRNLSAQEMKPQKRRSFWRRLLAIFWP